MRGGIIVAEVKTLSLEELQASGGVSTAGHECRGFDPDVALTLHTQWRQCVIGQIDRML